MYTTEQICASVRKAGFREWRVSLGDWMPVAPESMPLDEYFPFKEWRDTVLMPQAPAELALTDIGHGFHYLELR